MWQRTNNRFDEDHPVGSVFTQTCDKEKRRRKKIHSKYTGHDNFIIFVISIQVI
jgi:hypothetical protein